MYVTERPPFRFQIPERRGRWRRGETEIAEFGHVSEAETVPDRHPGRQ